MDTSETSVDLTTKTSFNHWTQVTIRFSDQDSMGHVNNVAIGSYFEASRTMFIGGIIGPFLVPNLDFILAKVVINYLREFHYPGIVDVGARVLRQGNKSLTTGYGAFFGEDCVATSEAVNVFYDMSRRVSTAPPEEVREALMREMGR